MACLGARGERIGWLFLGAQVAIKAQERKEKKGDGPTLSKQRLIMISIVHHLGILETIQNVTDASRSSE
jgi:hypothetical protein